MAKGVGWGAANKNYKHDQQATRLLQWITIMNIEGRKFCTMIAVIAHKYHQSKVVIILPILVNKLYGKRED